MLIKIEQKLRRICEHAFFLNQTFEYKVLKKMWHLSQFLCYTSLRFKVFICNLPKCDVLLINPHKLDAEKGIPIGIATIASYLQKYDVKTCLLDMNLFRISDKSLLFLIRKTKPLIVGIGAITFQAEEAYRVGTLIKTRFPSVKLVYGGVHPAFVTAEAFKEGKADFVVFGEGEQTLLKLFKTLKSGRTDFSKIRGLAYKKEGNVFKNKPCKFMPNINSLPFPTYYHLNLRAYNTDLHIHPYYKEFAVDLIGSRGCPNNCAYCATPQLYKHHVRLKDAKNIVAEIKSLRSRYGINYFHFHDDNFLIDRERVVKFCRIIKENSIKITWVCLTDINTLEKSKDIIPKLADTGCIGIEIGLENADMQVLKGLSRHQDLTCLLELNNLMKKSGITPMYLFMSFLPGETLDSVYKTSKLLEHLTNGECPNVIYFLKPVHSRFGLGLCANPYPGSNFFHTARKEGIILAKHWRDYYPTKISFIPYSFLREVPIKISKADKKDIEHIFRRYKKEIFLNHAYDVFNNENLKYYHEQLYRTYDVCDGKRSVEKICNMLRQQESMSVKSTCTAIRFLAMFGLVGSKKNYKS